MFLIISLRSHLIHVPKSTLLGYISQGLLKEFGSLKEGPKEELLFKFIMHPPPVKGYLRHPPEKPETNLFAFAFF